MDKEQKKIRAVLFRLTHRKLADDQKFTKNHQNKLNEWAKKSNIDNAVIKKACMIWLKAA
ncbi:hypothetical protein LU293_05115 [Moraxella nasovis]|uniref:hypothetical protein n=1 Tax=Moraxella nasovis TaxID=2904121 RepID=UPI001F61BB73|nr:hypothetical protein [Moraxella nasovis]UNU72505.1 hypothetical protein LU293_05115 [Moraxella nasovis]